MLLEAQPSVTALRQYKELLCATAKQFFSWLQLIFSDCAMTFYLLRHSDHLRERISPTTWGQQHPTCLLGERGAGGEHPSLPIGLHQGKAQFGTKYIYLDPGSKQLPKSVTATHRLPQLLQGEEVHLRSRLILRDRCSTGAVVLWAPGSPLPGAIRLCGGDALTMHTRSRHHPTLWTHPLLLQHRAKGFAWTAPAVFMDVPLPWSKPEAFPQSSPERRD